VRPSHWLGTLCALRLREPTRDDVTSDALCHTTALRRSSVPPASPITRAPHLAIKHPSDHRRARTRSIAACLRPLYTLPRTPSIGLMPNLAIEPSSFAIHCSCTRPSSAPFRAPRACPPCPRKSRRAALPCPFLDRLAAHLEDTGKMLLTDLCNRHSDTSTRTSPDSRARGLRRDVRLRDELRA
jgi:hypothetical protein